MTRVRAGRPLAALAALSLSALMLAACSSGHGGVRATGGSAPGGSTGPMSSTTSAPPPPTTVAGQLPTAFNCGGGAYKPATLLVLCGVATTTATDVQWASWTATGASGHGDVRLTGQQQPSPAELALGKVVPTENGPQFSQLTVTWTGASPDGHPVDVFQLATAPARG